MDIIVVKIAGAELDGDTDVSFGVNRYHGDNLEPAGTPILSTLTIVRTNRTGDNSLFEWAIKTEAFQQEVEIEYRDPSDTSKTFDDVKVKMENAYIVDYDFSCSERSGQVIVETVRIAAQKITVGSAELAMKWPQK